MLPRPIRNAAKMKKSVLPPLKELSISRVETLSSKVKTFSFRFEILLFRRSFSVSIFITRFFSVLVSSFSSLRPYLYRSSFISALPFRAGLRGLIYVLLGLVSVTRKLRLWALESFWYLFFMRGARHFRQQRAKIKAFRLVGSLGMASGIAAALAQAASE